VANEFISEVTVPVRHVRIAIDSSFEDARGAFESILLELDTRITAWLRGGEVDRARQVLEHGPDFSIFQSRDHGRVLRLAGLVRNAVQYDIGNPLTASTMTRHELAAALYAPIRVVLYEDDDGHAVFEYDRPSSLFGQFADERVTAVGRALDAAIERVLQQTSDEANRRSERRSTWSKWVRSFFGASTKKVSPCVDLR
jgi:uncharacterized protein (DUF302 family)